MENPTKLHWQACKRVLRFLKGTLTKSLFFHTEENENELVAYSDADWGCDPNDRKLMGGFCIYLGGNLVSWSSKKQSVVARSSTESEYRSLAATSTEITWLMSLLRDLKILNLKTPMIWCDNHSAASLAANPVHHRRTKHMEIDVHFVRNKVLNKELEIRFVPSHDQTADIMTKPLGGDRFNYLSSKLNVTERHSRLRGGCWRN